MSLPLKFKFANNHHNGIDYCIIYHANCADGFAAAWAIWKVLGDQLASYHPAAYGSEPPEEIKDRHVVIVDFSYSRKVLEEIKSKAKSLLVLDHHKSAEESLRDFEGAHFDMNRSGAGMAWDYFHEKPRPPLINYVEDRDLWNWKLPYAKELTAMFEIDNQSFQDLSEFNSKLESPEEFQVLVTKGSAVLEYKNSRVKMLSSKPYMVDISSICMLDDLTLQIPCVNSQLFQSEIGNVLAQKHPMAIVWYRAEDGSYRHSLRSNGKIDCSKIAQFWGGGGHANAAGFTTQEPLVRMDDKS
jgi:oligoribonuclease NrnB/cAMP/cGMP phosphodiesterase (DHH superfamily)